MSKGQTWNWSMRSEEALLHLAVASAVRSLTYADKFSKRTKKRRRAALRKAETALAAYLLSK